MSKHRKPLPAASFTKVSEFRTSWQFDLPDDIAPLSAALERQLAEAEKARARRFDRDLMDAVFNGVSATTNAEPASSPALTIDTARKTMESLPPKRTLISWKWFEGDNAWTFEVEREVIVIAGPAFWMQAEAELARRASMDAVLYGTAMWFGLSPFSVDPDPRDSDALAERRVKERGRIVELMHGKVEAWLNAEGVAWLMDYRRVQP